MSVEPVFLHRGEEPFSNREAGRVADHESAARFQHAGHLLDRELWVRVVMERERAEHRGEPASGKFVVISVIIPRMTTGVVAASP